MTVPVQSPTVSYTGNGVTVTFTYPFRIIRAEDLDVMLDGQAPAVPPVINGIGEDEGSVTFATAPASGVSIILSRDVVLERSNDYQDNGDLLADTLNSDFDRLWMALQILGYLLGGGNALTSRALLIGPTDVNGSGAYRANGNRIQNLGYPLADTDAATYGAARDIAERITSGAQGALGTFVQNGPGAIVRTFQDKMREVVSIQDFGARPIPGFDNSIPLQLAAWYGGRIYVPAGVYEYSVTPSSVDVPIFLHGDGLAKSQLIQTTAGANGWNHGQVERPAYGATFQAENISFRRRGKGGIALNVKLNPVSGQFVMEDVQISGEVTDAGDGWHDPVSALGCSLTDWTNVIMIGPIGENLSNVGNGATFGTYERDDITNPGSYVYNIRGGASNYYRAGFVFNSPTYSGVEGVTMTEVNCNGCINFVVQNNDIYPTNHYRPPQYMFDECQFEGFGSMFRFSGASYVWITDSLCYIDAPNSRVPSDFSPQDTVYFHNSYGIKIEGNQFIAYPGSVIQYFVHFAAGDEGCSYARLRDNAFLCNGTCDGAVRAGAGSVSIREYGSDKYIWPAGNPPVFVDDTFPGQSGNFSKTSIAQKFATCDDFGNISYSFTTTGTTDASGVLTVTLPAGMYRQVTNVIATNGDSNASSASCEVIWSTVTSSQFQVKFNGLSAPTAVRCNLTVSGF